MHAFLELKNVSKSYKSGSKWLDVVRDFDLKMVQGELLAVVGRSGTGKTTLLNLIAGLDRVDTGGIFLDGEDLTRGSQATWDKVRAERLGFIFQFNQLLPEFTALENVMMPGLIARREAGRVRGEAQNLLDRLGLGDRCEHRPAQLSGGEQQRVAMARALINKPQLILADEPTGSLDPESGRNVFQMLRDLQKDLKISCILVTHNPALADLCDRIVSLDEGRIAHFGNLDGGEQNV